MRSSASGMRSPTAMSRAPSRRSSMSGMPATAAGSSSSPRIAANSVPSDEPSSRAEPVSHTKATSRSTIATSTRPGRLAETDASATAGSSRQRVAQRAGVDRQQADAALPRQQSLEVARRSEVLAGPGDLRHAQPRPAQERHEHRGGGNRAEARDDATDRRQASGHALPERRSRAPGAASATPRPGLCAWAARPAPDDLRLWLQLHRSRSMASSMSRAMRASNGRPAISACLGYMLVAVKPGSVFISLMKASSGVTRKSIRARPAPSTAR